MAVLGALRNDIKEFVNLAEFIWLEAADIYDLFWKVGISTELSGIASDTDPATKVSKLSKGEVNLGLTLAEQFKNFFQNSAVAQNDYLHTMENLIYGSDERTIPGSAGLEAVGDRLRVLSEKALQAYKLGRKILITYIANDAGNADPEPSVPMTMDQLSSGVTLVEQFTKMVSNQAVATGDYTVSLGKWRPL